MLDGAIANASVGTGANPDLPGSLLPSLLINRAEVHRDLGEPGLAISVIEQALRLRRKLGNQRLTAMNLIIYAYALIDDGRLCAAEDALTEAQELTEEIGDTLHATYVTQTLADVDTRRGRWRRAASRLDRALPEFEAVSNDDGIAEAYRARGELAVAMGDPAAAVEPFRASLAIWRQLSAPLEAARLLARLAHAHEGAGQPGAAATCRAEYQAILADLELPEVCLRLPPW
jgi:tetratricopeptide (TPR) repeat protein